MRIIPRAEWGARYANGCGPAPLPAVEVWLHHSVTRADNGPGIIRELEQIGQSRFGCGISYTWPITPDGTVYEGHSVNRQGTHTGGRNDRARAICFVGNYDNDQATPAQMAAAAWLLQHAHTNGWIDAPRLDGGHRDVKATGCPGRYAYAAIPTINHLAAGGLIKEEDMAGELVDAEIKFAQERLAAGAGGRLADYWLDAAIWAKRNNVKLDAIAGQINDTEADIITATRAAIAADQDTQLVLGPEHIDAIVAGLKAGLPPSITREDIEASVRRVFADAGTESA